MRDVVLSAVNTFEFTRNQLRKSFFVIPKLDDGLFVWQGPGASIHSGEMIIQPKVEDASGKREYLDEFLPEGFVILGIGGDPSKELDSEALALCADLNAELVSVAPRGTEGAAPLKDYTTALTTWRGPCPPFVLLRPDRFTAAMFDADDAAASLRNFKGLYAA